MAKYRFWSIVVIACSVWAAFFVFNGEPFKLGLDLSGGTHLVYRADTSGVASGDIESAMTSLRDTIERRVNLFGVAEPIVQVEQGSALEGEREQRLIVELPGITDVEEAVKKIGETPILEFKLLNQDSGEFVSTGLSGSKLERAELRFDSNQIGSAPIVGLKFNSEGRALFAQITRENIGKVLGIFLDGSLLQAPYIKEEISEGEAVITGSFTVDEAKQIVRDLNYGALPMPVELIGTETIGATLGGEALSSGVRAAVVGLLLVALFMIVWYKLPGFISVLALSVYVIAMLLLFKIVPVTLTAAGIAGFIISIGMAIDANIIIFERLKELRAQNVEGAEAVGESFKHAWSAIRDGQLTTFLGALVLFWFGTSSVEGFALVLGLGTLVSVWSSMFASRIFMYSIYLKN